MTEAEWLASEDPQRMINACVANFYHLSDRKLRLFACACVRQVWHLLTDERCRRCVETAERYADDPSTTLTPFYDDAAERFEEMDAEDAIEEGLGLRLWQAVLARHCCNKQDDFASGVSGSILPALLRKGRVSPVTQASLLRDVAGNPFAPVKWWHRRKNMLDLGPGTQEPGPDYDHVQPWLTPDVRGIATEVYEARAFDLLPVLADALESAGCDNEPILRHLRGFVRCVYCLESWDDPDCEEWCTYCGRERWMPEWWGRTPSPSLPLHARGCWVVNLVLGKE